MRRVRRDDRGSALVLALVFLAVFGVWIASVLTFSVTTQKVGTAVRAQRGTVYGADGAVEQAIQLARYDINKGKEGLTNCGTSAVLNGQTVYVSCLGQTGSGTQIIGGSSPTLGIITLATGAEDGLLFASNATVRIDGGVYSHSAINPGGSSSQLNACPPTFPATQSGCAPPPGSKGTVTALGGCDTNRIVAAVVRCPNGQPDLSGEDPLLAPAQTSFGAPVPVPNCPGAKKVIAFSPGRYTDATRLTALTDGSCKSALLWFQPGNYYFDFPANNAVWTMSNKDVTVVGGTKTWTSDPADPSTLAVPGTCVGDDIADHAGVQFIFGGTSRIDMSSGRMELCATRAGTAQQVALFGVKTSTGSLVAQSGCITATPYTATDSTHCALVRTNGSQSAFVVHGTVYAPAAALDIGLTNFGYQVISRGIVSRVLVLKFTPSASFTGSVIYSPGLGSVTSDRRMLLTACVNAPCGSAGSVTKLRAMVRFHDQDAGGATSAGFTATIESWSVVR